ncbi:MAG: hypothetical protein GXP25_05585 [Planctomycetes bacterium]|nr:hypothetical protein [Planctomycetota bacterium]
MRKWLACLAAICIGTSLIGCAEREKQDEKDKVRVQAPFVDVRVKEDGSTRVKAPGTDIQVDN